MIYRFTDCTINPIRPVLIRSGIEIHLSPRIFKALMYFLRNHNRLILKSEFVHHVWGNIKISANSVDRCLADVRKAIGDEGIVLRTIHGHGYIFEATIEEQGIDFSEEHPPIQRTGRPYVFISYSHIDWKIAKSLATELSRLKIEHFLDRKDISWGQSINGNVREALLKCSHQIIIVSPASVKSPWVHFEVGFAMGAHRVVLPFLTHQSLDVPHYLGDLIFKTSLKEIEDYFYQWIGKYTSHTTSLNKSALSHAYLKIQSGR